VRLWIWLHNLAAATALSMVFVSAPSIGQTNFIVEDESGMVTTSPRVAAPRKPDSQFAVNHYIELDRPLDFGEHFWDESFARASGARGSAQIVVDLQAEQLYVYRSGVEIARTRITRGWEEYDTPTGVFPILEKDADHYSSTYNNAPMPYNLRLTWKGVAIHGAEVDSLSATHGCIGVPLEFARKLFANVRKGDEVLVTRQWRRRLYR
tara:strand:+ start:4341 stop:4964 length:624 start_codon:yes stop_codon:yes gene_type:complete